MRSKHTEDGCPRHCARTRGALLAWMLVLGGCGDTGAGGTRESGHGSAQVGGTVVSTVNGYPISIADVRSFAERSGLSPREALERLQAEQLLMAEAEQRGISSPAIDLVAARARTQALLDAEAQEIQLSDAELRSAYDRDARFKRGERRASVHVLAILGKKPTPEQEKAARAVAVEAIASIGTLSPEAIVERYKGQRNGIELRVERLPPVEREGQFVEEFAAALFSRNDPGVIAEPVRTRFGWHAIRLLEITPAQTVPFEQVAGELRKELVTQRRSARATALITELRQRHGASIEDEALQKLSAVGNE
jgi:parvulin-like peptidyl-prolyl isomerase